MNVIFHISCNFLRLDGPNVAIEDGGPALGRVQHGSITGALLAVASEMAMLKIYPRDRGSLRLEANLDLTIPFQEVLT